ncbi:MAG: hypothetical protein YK1309IOTA_1400001 [Marine Group I thaumarchaeote]|nr:MAG: hypothetical protein YK1309IOTA_1400001 [Marine Group I thaumarchaeote]
MVLFFNLRITKKDSERSGFLVNSDQKNLKYIYLIDNDRSRGPEEPSPVLPRLNPCSLGFCD